MKWMIPGILVAALVSLCLAADKSANQNKGDEKQKPAQSIDELRLQLEKILKDTHIPGLSVAIVHRARWAMGDPSVRGDLW